GCRAGACAIATDIETGRAVLLGEPVDRDHDPHREALDIEAEVLSFLVVALLERREEIEQQGRVAGLDQLGGDKAVAATAPATAAAVREDDHAPRLVGQPERRLELTALDRN